MGLKQPLHWLRGDFGVTSCFSERNLYKMGIVSIDRNDTGVTPGHRTSPLAIDGPGPGVPPHSLRRVSLRNHAQAHN